MSEMVLSMTAGIAAMSTRLTDAAAIAKAALVCAESGSEREALRIALDLDELLSEATTLHDAICLLGRMSRRRDEAARHERSLQSTATGALSLLPPDRDLLTLCPAGPMWCRSRGRAGGRAWPAAQTRRSDP